MQLKSQEIFYGLLVCYMSWLGLTATSNANAVSTLRVQQIENERVNREVDSLKELVIRIDANVQNIKENLVRK